MSISFRILFVFCMAFVSCAHSQIQKPSVMVMPSKNWMTQKGYFQTIDNQGIEEQILDYQKALAQDKELSLVLNKLSAEFCKIGFDCKSFQTEYENYKQEQASDIFAQFPEADLRVEINWSIESQGPQKRVSNFSLLVYDSYTNKMIAMFDGSGSFSALNASTTDLLYEIYTSRTDEIERNILSYLENVYKNGQEISLRIYSKASFDGDLQSVFNGVSLSTIIIDWMAKNSVNGSYELQNETENRMFFGNIKRPALDENQKPITSYTWLNKLAAELKEKYNIPCKVEAKSKYNCSLVIG